MPAMMTEDTLVKKRKKADLGRRSRASWSNLAKKVEALEPMRL
jgi:hypothetical protein